MALEDLFEDIADAIREKDGTTAEIVAGTFPARIRAIPTGIGGVQLESILIATPPAKTVYVVGETFDFTGMVVTATYSNGQTMYVDQANLTFDPSGPLEEGTTSITVNFQWGLKMVSAFQPVVVLAVPATLEDCSWNQISALSASGKLKDYFPALSKKSITLNGNIGNTDFTNVTLDAMIIGHDHNQEIESPGEHRTHFLAFTSGQKILGLVDSQYYNEVTETGWFSLNVGNVTAGGYPESQLYKYVIPTVKLALPQELQGVLKSVTKYTYVGTSEMKAITDSVFPPSTKEYFGTTNGPDTGDKQEFYAALSSFSSADKKIYRYNDQSSPMFTLLRDINNSYAVNSIYVNGEPDRIRAGLGAGFIFIFTV